MGSEAEIIKTDVMTISEYLLIDREKKEEVILNSGRQSGKTLAMKSMLNNPNFIEDLVEIDGVWQRQIVGATKKQQELLK